MNKKLTVKTTNPNQPAADNPARRQLAKGVLATGAIASGGALLPSAWTKPVIDSVLLPVHAVTSGAPRTFSVEVSNLTAGQPFSPPAVVAHSSAFSVTSIGATASGSLEELAEGGSPAGVVADASASSAVYEALAFGGPVPPGSASATSITVNAASDINITVTTMLVVTNDGITSETVPNLEALDVGQSANISGPAYDAGTEDNDELMANIPGTGGEGFNAANSGEAVSMHPGIQGVGDLPGSAAFSGNVITVTVTRTA